MALMGDNGAGKTTLLKVLYGIYRPTTGRVEIEGRIDGMFNVGLGFRREATGRRNIFLRGLINGWSPEDIEARMDEIVAFSGVGDFIDMPLKTYSQGMSARLAFSIASSLQPEILLMDEWINAGDREFRQKARERMLEISAQARILVLATHNKNLMRRVCNKVLKLECGRAGGVVDIADYLSEGEDD